MGGVVSIQSAGVGGCTGSLLADGVSILTAGHCVGDGYGGFVSPDITVSFQGPDGIVNCTATSVSVPIPAIREIPPRVPTWRLFILAS